MELKEPIDFFRNTIEYTAQAFGIGKLYDWQINAINDVLDGKQVVLRAANGSGKTACCVVPLGLHLMCQFPGIRIASTSGSWLQIQSQLFPNLRARVANLPEWKCTADKLTAPPISVGDGISVQSVWEPFSVTDPGRAEGYHPLRIGDYTCKVAFIMDEAKTISRGVFEAMDRCTRNFTFVCSSPGEDYGAFYDCFDKYAEAWKPYVITWKMCPHLYGDPVKRKEIEREIRMRGESDPLVQSKYYGNWMAVGGYQVFPDTAKIKDAMKGTAAKWGTDRRGAVDTSDGGDEQVFGCREGNTMLAMKSYHEKNILRLAKLLVADFKQWALCGEQITVDNGSGGGGKGLTDILAQYGYTGITRYQNAAAPRDKTVYGNRYTEDCFEHLSYHLDKINLLPDDKLERQMRTRKFVMPNDDSNRRRLESKEVIRNAGRESPDRLDMVIMLYATLPHPDNFDGKRRPTSAYDRYNKSFADDVVNGNSTWTPYAGMRGDA